MSEKKQTYYERFTLLQRIEHLVMLTSFTTLGLTGLIQKYPLASVSEFFFKLLGGIEMVRNIHHVAAIMMMIGTAYHIVAAGYKIIVLRKQMSMLPVLQDAKDGLQAFLYNLGFAKSRPQMGRYTFEEKMEYWAFVWGAIVMGATGFIMWNPITTTKFLPGEIIPAAKAAHGGEALLAVLAIVVWHFYGVHIKHLNKAMFTGKMSEEEMLHEHPLELADIKAGVLKQTTDPVALRKRQKIYIPIASVLAIAMMAAIIAFVSYENTAPITTVPHANNIEAFVPQTPTPIPTPTPVEEVELTFDAYVGPLFEKNCIACHGETATAGLNLSSFATMNNGSASGPVIVAGDSANSLLITIQEAGGHPGQLNSEAIEYLKEWIDVGAPEN